MRVEKSRLQQIDGSGTPRSGPRTEELLTAYGMVKQLHPDLDRQTEAAIHQHLCSFDII